MDSDTRTHEDWTAAQSTRTVTVDGHDLEVAYYDSADGDGADTANQDPPVVFVHGIPTWSYLWRDVAPAVAEATDRRVIVPDLLGYGNSDMHDGFDRSIRAQERLFDDLFDQLDVTELSLVAHDIGGGVAVRYAAHNPAAVEHLVMSNAVCYDSWPVEFIADIGMPDMPDRDHEEFMSMLEGAFRQGLYDDVDETFIEGIAHPWDSQAGQLSLCRNAVSTNTTHTTELDYDAIEADLLCLWGGDDVMQPLSYGERLAADVGGEVVELDAYHWVVEDRPGEYADEVTAFLTE